jgi:hypothetical protein
MHRILLLAHYSCWCDATDESCAEHATDVASNPPHRGRQTEEATGRGRWKPVDAEGQWQRAGEMLVTRSSIDRVMSRCEEEQVLSEMAESRTRSAVSDASSCVQWCHRECIYRHTPVPRLDHTSFDRTHLVPLSPAASTWN